MDYGIIGSRLRVLCVGIIGMRACSVHACARSQRTDNRAWRGEKEYDDEIYGIRTIAARTVGQVEKDESDAVGATNKYCAKPVEDEEGDKKDNEDEEEKRRIEAQADDDDLDALKAPFNPLPSSPTLCFV
jgi:hypothetical protein